MNVLKKDILNLRIQKKNLDYLIQKYKIEKTSSKNFSVYQNQIDLYKNLKDSNINPKEVLKNQINFESDLSKIKTWKSQIKIRRSNKCNTKC